MEFMEKVLITIYMSIKKKLIILESILWYARIEEGKSSVITITYAEHRRSSKGNISSRSNERVFDQQCQWLVKGVRCTSKWVL